MPKRRFRCRSLDKGVVVALVFALAAAGCAPTVREHTYDTPIPAVGIGTSTLVLEVGASALPRESAALLEAFLKEYANRGRGPVEIDGPSEPADVIAQFARAHGVPQAMIRVRPVHADAGAVRVSYSRFAAARVQCGDWRDDLGFNPSNRLAHNFGCAVRAGVGLMMADPADLQVSRPAASHDSMRSNVVVQKYRAGEPTAARAPKEDQVIFSLTRGK